MIGYIKEPQTSIFLGQTGCGKTHLASELIEKEYIKHFDFIIIICATLRESNKTYHVKERIKNDDKIWLVDPKDILYQWIKKLSELLWFPEVLFIIDDIIANESLAKKRQPLLELSISGRHRGYYLWLLTQSYTAIPKNLRRQSAAIFVWYPKEKTDPKMIHDENDELTDDELVAARNVLRCMFITCQNMHVYIYEMNFLKDFVLNKKWQSKRKINNTRKTSWTPRPRS